MMWFIDNGNGSATSAHLQCYTEKCINVVFILLINVFFIAVVFCSYQISEGQKCPNSVSILSHWKAVTEHCVLPQKIYNCLTQVLGLKAEFNGGGSLPLWS